MRHFTENPKVPFSFDLHVLGTPPAFILSQDQTLQFNSEVAFCATNRSLLYLADWFSKIDFSLTGRRPPRQSELKQIIVLLELCQQKSSLFSFDSLARGNWVERKSPERTQGIFRFRRRPTLPHSCPCSTIGAIKLNFRVRDGNGCDLDAIATEKLFYLYEQDDSCSGCVELYSAKSWPYQDECSSIRLNINIVAKPHDRLVLVSFMHCCTSTPSLSTS